MANQERQWASRQRINFSPAFLRIPFLVYGDSPAIQMDILTSQTPRLISIHARKFASRRLENRASVRPNMFACFLHPEVRKCCTAGEEAEQ
jgi:hypothetical protein